MSKKANPTAIGLFVVVAVILAVAGILVLGSGKMFQTSKSFVLYFDNDLNGLDVGAPVTTRGVKIGEVKNISIVYDHRTDTLSTPVVITINQGSFVEVNGASDAMDGARMDLQIERGLRGQLETQSLVTGKLRVNLGLHPENKPVFHAKDGDLPEIPTMPTTLQSLTKDLSEIPIKEIMEDLRKSSAAVSKFFESGKLDQTFDELNRTLVDLSEMIEKTDVQSLVVSLDDTLKVSRELMSQLGREAKPLQRELAIALEGVTDAANSARTLMDYLERHPEALIYGKGNQK